MCKENIFEDVRSEEYLSEMASTLPNTNYATLNYSFAVNPDNSHKGNAYFKVYDNKQYTKATKVIRINFMTPTVVTNHRERHGKKEWKLSDFTQDDREAIIEYLKMPASKNPNITVWTSLRFDHNVIKGLCFSIDNYIAGKDDTPENLQNPDYVPYNIEIRTLFHMIKSL